MAPRLMEKLDGKLWHEITFPHGDVYGTKNFFNENITHGANSNVYQGSLPHGQMFRISRISLMPALSALPADVDTLLSNSYFSFEGATKQYYSGPAQTFYKSSKGIDDILGSIKKLPRKVQKSILENIKTPAGMELSAPHELLSLEFFRGRFDVPTTIRLKKEVKLTCLLEGKLLREIY